MSSNICIACNSDCTIDAINILENNIETVSHLSIQQLIAKHLGTALTNSTNANLICKNCVQLLDNAEELQNKLTQLKNKISYNCPSSNTEECVPEESINTETDNSDFATCNEYPDVHSPPKKNLDPEGEFTIDNITNEETSLKYIDEIELQLIKIHDGDIPEGQLSQNVDTTISFHGFNDDEIIEANSIQQYKATISKIPKLDDGTVVDKEKYSLDSDGKPILLNKRIAKLEDNVESTSSLLQSTVVSQGDQLFTCTQCPNGGEVIFEDIRGIITHMRTIHGLRVYFCDVCGQDFRKRNELSAHLNEHMASEEGDFQCEICNRIFSSLRLYRIHRRSHNTTVKSWNCEVCCKKFTSRNLLEEHTNSHTGLRPYHCYICGKRFASKYTFKSHQKVHEFRPRSFCCSYCNKTFVSQHNLQTHKRIHEEVKEYDCHLCGKQFGSSNGLERHSVVHSGRKPYLCGICNKAFARRAEIRDHERTHTGERPFQCEFCGATFTQKSNLQSHKRVTHMDDKRYKCTECSRAFKRRRLLDYHVKAAHTGERPYKCGVCDASFVYPEHFKKHRRIHTGEKPYHCEVCGKAFNSRDNRNAHRFTHSDKKPYECLECGAGFMRKPQLYHHMKAENHINDTIVVNQPRLTPDDERLVTVNPDGEMEVVEVLNESETLEKTGVLNTRRLFVTESDMTVTEDCTEESENDGKAMESTISFEDQSDQNKIQTVIDEHNIPVHADGTLSAECFSSSNSKISEITSNQTAEIRLVKVVIPNGDGKHEETWIKIVPD